MNSYIAETRRVESRKVIARSLGLCGLGLILNLPAGAQFAQGIPSFLVSTNSGTNAITVASGATTNIPTGMARIIQVGPRGFGVSVYATAAGISLATNTLVFETSGDAVNWVLAPTLSVFVTNCTATPVSYFTNFPETAQNIGNLKAVRLKYITNSAAQITYWSNLVVTTRP